MQILSAAQIREWDNVTMRTQGITSMQLMERAAQACREWIMQRCEKSIPFLVLCGTGNNGGDGFAIARLLHQQGYGVAAFLVGDKERCSADCAKQLQKLQALEPALVAVMMADQEITSIGEDVIIIDALLGTGLSRAVDGAMKNFIEGINKLPNKKVSIDLPSGLIADSLLPESNSIRADFTLTLGCYKRTLLHPEGGAGAGEVCLIDIGLDKDFPATQNCWWHTMDDVMARSLYRPRAPFTHKGTHGTALIIGGSKGLIGAALLAAQAAGRAGAGKVRVLVPECGYGIVQTAAPEAMCRTSGQDALELIDGWEGAQGIGVGPGMTGAKAKEAFAAFLKRLDRPVLLDAESLNILGERKELMSDIPAGSILTPHPKEFERLAGETLDSFARADLARKLAIKYRINIVLKDRHTIILTPSGNGFYNLSGNAGLATGGSGDVLTGIITGLLAQQYSPVAAAMLGVWLHGKAGQAASQKAGAMEAVIAGDIVAEIGAGYAILNG